MFLACGQFLRILKLLGKHYLLCFYLTVNRLSLGCRGPPSKEGSCVRAIDLVAVRLAPLSCFLGHCLCCQAFVKAGNIQMYFIPGLVAANHSPANILEEQRHLCCFGNLQAGKCP